MLTDLRYAFRELAKTPGFTADGTVPVASGCQSRKEREASRAANIPNRTPMKPPSRFRAWSWLTAGAVCLLVANGRWAQAWGAWAALFCLLRFSSEAGPWRGFLAILIAGFGTNLLVWEGLLPLPAPLYQIVGIVNAVFLAAPILMHRFLSTRLRGLTATLAYPCALVATQYLISKISPSCTYGSIAYTQTFGPLLQIVSLAGIWGLLFFLGWSVSVADRWARRAPMGLGPMVYLFSAVVLLGFGSVRWFSSPAKTATVKIAGLIGAFDFGRSIKDNEEAFHKASNEAGRQLLERSAQAANAGAKIVFWQEAALPLLKDEESRFLAIAADFARANQILLGVSLFVMPVEFPHKWADNKIVWLNPAGDRVSDYAKAHPTPAEAAVPGQELIQSVAFNDTRLASAICFDMDFPAFLRQAGAQQVGLLCVPANDNREITPYHARITAFRAIEQGLTVIRATGNGLSVAYDSTGRELDALTCFDNAEGRLLVNVPFQHRHTLYTAIGDALVWVCTGGLLLLLATALRDSRRATKVDPLEALHAE